MNRLIPLLLCACSFSACSYEDIDTDPDYARQKARELEWKRFLAQAVSLKATPPPLPTKDVGEPGFARFEVLGMMSEYIERHMGPENALIEHFWVGEDETAQKFKALLIEYCEEEKLPPQIKTERPGDEGKHTNYYSKPIAKSLDAYFNLSKDAWHPFGGNLADSFLNKASETDLLRFIKGTSVRHGKRKNAVFYTTNSFERLKVIRKALTMLGCTGMRFFRNPPNNIPTVICVVFKPSAKVAKTLGLETKKPKPPQDFVPFDEMD